jgi:hypothetical protein
VTVAGNLSCTGSCTGINASSNSGGTIAFTAGTKTFSTGGSAAVTLANNGGTTINFTGGGLAISTTSGTGFDASGGAAAINITTGGNPNTISTTAGRALSIASSTIGASGVTFRSISAAGGTSGIVLSSTGNTGAFQVTGNGGLCDATHISGTDCTGGTIQTMTARGVDVSHANNVSFKHMYFKNNSTTVVSVGSGCQGNVSTGSNDPCNAPVHISTTTNVTLDTLFIDGSSQHGINTDSVAAFHMTHTEVENIGSLSGVDQAALSMHNLLGTSNITGSNIHENHFSHNVFITNNLGVANFTFNADTIQNVGTPQNSDGFQFDSYGTANVTVNVNNTGGRCYINRLVSNGISFQSSGSSTMNATASGCFVNKTSGLLGQGSGTSTATITFNADTITNKLTSDGWGNGSNAITIGKSSPGTSAVFHGIVTNNVINKAQCGGGCRGIDANAFGNGTETMVITGNLVQHVDQEGIAFTAGQGSTNSVVTMQANTVTNPDVSGSYAMEITLGTQSGDAPCVAWNVGDMSVGHAVSANRNIMSNGSTGFSWVGSGGAPSISAIAFYSAGLGGAFKLFNYTGSTDAQAQAWIVASNTGASSDAFTGAAPHFTGGTTCP